MNFEQEKLKLFSTQSESERVEVNQRHLIDKILARYSAQHTIYRELLQNSNDAQATKVVIRFKTLDKKIVSLSYQNNGKIFSDTDFTRLTKIAQGNPDEQKIGFFGVGFYSLFSICEEPFLSSGNQSMGFFWKGDTLYTKRGLIETENVTEWTTFWLKCREPMELVKLNDFAKFLATSLAFTTFVKEVEVIIDNDRIQYFHKKVSAPRPLSFKSGDYTLKSQSSIFTLMTTEIQSMQLDVTIKEEKSSFLSPTRIEESEFTLFTRIAVGNLKVSLPKDLEKEMERTTKKSPPSNAKLQIIYSNYDEYSSSNTMKEKTDIFTDLLPGPTAQGRVFIGFPTFQTTGCSIQLSAHLIPTVERESIDFVDRTLNIWNQEMLAMGGLLARIVAEDDLDATETLYKELSLDSTSEEWLQKKSNHNLVSFTFNHSTPSPMVGKIVSVYFYKLSTRPIRMVSTKGLLPVSAVRLNDPELANFFKSVPIVPPETEIYCKDLIKRLMDNSQLKKATLDDLFDELAQRPLSMDETIFILQYWINKWRQKIISRNISDRLSTVLVLADGNELIPMSIIKHYAVPQLVCSDLPMPNSVMPMKITKNFKVLELEQALWGLTPLTVLKWLDFIIKDERFALDPNFTEKVMCIFSRHFTSLSQQEKGAMLKELSHVNCVVTRFGMKKPSDSYFKSVSLFEDLPTVHWNNPRSISDPFQRAIGIREHVELQLVFDRLMDLNWNHTQLIKYLTSVQDKLTDGEMTRLRATPMFPKECPKDNQTLSKERFNAKELFAPLETFRTFDLPLLAWNGKWRYNSDEGILYSVSNIAKFMGKLGLNLFLPIDLFIQMSSSSPPKIRMALINYFVSNYESSYASQYRASDVKVPFLPINDDENNVCTPLSCFSEDGAQVLGFKILHRDLRQHSQKLGVKSHPTNQALLQALQSDPPTFEKANPVFNYLSSRQYDFDRDDWLQLKSMRFIPVLRNGTTLFMAPLNVYFRNSEENLLSEQFDYIDFGISCNSFLKACGVKDEPSPVEVAQMIIQDPGDVLSKRGVENYLSLLRQIATNYSVIKQNSKLVSNMKNSPFLVGVKSKDQNPMTMNDADVVYQLAFAKDIYLIDDTVIGQLFNALGAPVESVLEKMYEDLGSSWLSKQVKDVITPIGPVQETVQAHELQKLIHERASLLLYDGQHLRNTQEIVPNSDKLLKNLKVYEVSEIEQSRNFLGIVKKQKTTACMLADRESKRFILYTCPDLDYFDVASSLSRIIFKKPRLNDSLLLSTLLSTSLENLRRKGFPVDRILNLKKAMNYVEQAQSQQKVEPSVARLDPQGKLAQLSSLFPDIDQSIIMEELRNATGTQNPIMVAADALAELSLQNPKSDQTIRDKKSIQNDKGLDPTRNTDEYSGGMFKMLNSIKKNLGFQTEASQPLSSSGNGSNQNPILPNTVDRNINPSNTMVIKNHLSNSISRLSTVDDSRIHTKVPMDPPSNLPPQKNQCQIIADADLILISTVEDLRFYLEKEIVDSDRAQIANHQLERFSLVLKHLAHVFRIDIRTIAIYWDLKGDTIAFNRSRSLFFNAKYYSGLHFPKVKFNSTSSIPGSFSIYGSSSKSIKDEDLNTFFYWFMVFCHELAHNFVSNHDSNHEFWMSSFAEQYMSDLIVMLQRIGKI